MAQQGLPFRLQDLLWWGPSLRTATVLRAFLSSPPHQPPHCPCPALGRSARGRLDQPLLAPHLFPGSCLSACERSVYIWGTRHSSRVRSRRCLHTHRNLSFLGPNTNPVSKGPQTFTKHLQWARHSLAHTAETCRLHVAVEETEARRVEGSGLIPESFCPSPGLPCRCPPPPRPLLLISRPDLLRSVLYTVKFTQCTSRVTTTTTKIQSFHHPRKSPSPLYSPSSGNH